MPNDVNAGTPSVDVTPAVDASASAGSAGSVDTTPKAVDLADDALVSFKVGNESVTKPWGEVRNTLLPQAGDYTRKTMATAAERRQLEADRQSFLTERQQVEQARQEIQSIVQDPQRLAALYLASVANQRTQGQQSQQAPNGFDPRAIQQWQQQVLQQQQAQFQQFQEEQEARQISAELGDYTNGLIKDHPILSSLDDFSELVHGTVIRMAPNSVQEAKAYTKQVVDAYVQKLDARQAELKKEAAVNKSRLSGIEPLKGGSPVVAKPRTYGSLEDPKRTEDMIAFMQQALAGEE